MEAGPSTLSIVAVLLYAAVAFCAILAASRAQVRRQVAWHTWAWYIIAALFLALALARLLNVEEWLRGDLRSLLYSEHAYERRRMLQRPLFALLFIVAATVVAGLFYHLVRGQSGRRNTAAVVALGCTGGMLFLLLLRLVSLHSVDAVLYGPLKLNWVADIGLSLTVIASALSYRKVVGARSG